MKKQIPWLLVTVVMVIVLVAAGALLYNAATGGLKGEGKRGEVKSLAGKPYPGLLNPGNSGNSGKVQSLAGQPYPGVPNSGK